jgi:hypothetical protein
LAAPAFLVHLFSANTVLQMFDRRYQVSGQPHLLCQCSEAMGKECADEGKDDANKGKPAGNIARLDKGSVPYGEARSGENMQSKFPCRYIL